MDEEIVVPPEIAGLFEESDNQVNYCLVINCDVSLSILVACEYFQTISGFMPYSLEIYRISCHRIPI